MDRRVSVPVVVKKQHVVNFLSNAENARRMIEFCQATYCEEYILFYAHVEKYKRLDEGSEEQLVSGLIIFDQHLEVGAPLEVGIDDIQRAMIRYTLSRMGSATNTVAKELHISNKEFHTPGPLNTVREGGGALAYLNSGPVSPVTHSTTVGVTATLAEWESSSRTSRTRQCSSTAIKPNITTANSKLFDVVQAQVLCMVLVDAVPKYEQKYGQIGME